MANPVILDTGPLVAMIDGDDHRHDWVKSQLASLRPPFLTCEAVISEAMFLLPQAKRGLPTLLSLLREGLVQVSFDFDDNLEAVTQLVAKYQDLPMSMADACLVRMSELHDRTRVFTLDSHFRIYRRHGRQSIPLIFPR